MTAPPKDSEQAYNFGALSHTLPTTPSSDLPQSLSRAPSPAFSDLIPPEYRQDDTPLPPPNPNLFIGQGISYRRVRSIHISSDDGTATKQPRAASWSYQPLESRPPEQTTDTGTKRSRSYPDPTPSSTTVQVPSLAIADHPKCQYLLSASPQGLPLNLSYYWIQADLAYPTPGTPQTFPFPNEPLWSTFCRLRERKKLFWNVREIIDFEWTKCVRAEYERTLLCNPNILLAGAEPVHHSEDERHCKLLKVCILVNDEKACNWASGFPLSNVSKCRNFLDRVVINPLDLLFAIANNTKPRTWTNVNELKRNLWQEERRHWPRGATDGLPSGEVIDLLLKPNLLGGKYDRTRKANTAQSFQLINEINPHAPPPPPPSRPINPLSAPFYPRGSIEIAPTGPAAGTTPRRQPPASRVIPGLANNDTNFPPLGTPRPANAPTSQTASQARQQNTAAAPLAEGEYRRGTKSDRRRQRHRGGVNPRSGLSTVHNPDHPGWRQPLKEGSRKWEREQARLRREAGIVESDEAEEEDP
ncbi:hypothetical protein B9Z65_4074 [Elsinoe australis]|uniref:Uncharacterized protein n=1 Tax=Elsinoe australis TaxID=40998 RepID=A0A2P7Z1R5_9PEZI|nr:hypothetical protein B9Z65_4074 [Elsinoe australis]